jgi:hypothetical protein
MAVVRHGRFRSDTSIIERITLQSGGGTSRIAHGIIMQVKVALSDLGIVAFPGEGIHIEGNPPGCCNTFERQFGAEKWRA